MEEHLGPFRKNVEVPTTMRGVSDTAASVDGIDVTRVKRPAWEPLPIAP